LLFPIYTTPIYIKSKISWEFDSTVKTSNYAINKGKHGESTHFNIPDVFELFKYRHPLRFLEHLKKQYINLVVELEKFKSANDKNEYLSAIKSYKTKLEKSRRRVETRQICYNPELDSDNFSKDHLYHKDVNLIYRNTFNTERIEERGYLNFLIAEMVENQIQIIDDTLEFLNEELQSVSGSEESSFIEDNYEPENSGLNSLNESEERGFNRIRFRTNINVLVTLFYDLKEKNYIRSSKANLTRFLHESFSNENGEALNKNTIDTILNTSKGDKRAKDDVKIIVPDL